MKSEKESNKSIGFFLFSAMTNLKQYNFELINKILH